MKRLCCGGQSQERCRAVATERAPSRPSSRRRHRQPKCNATSQSVSARVPAAVSLHRDLGCWRRERMPGGSVPGCRPEGVAFFQVPSCQHHSREFLLAQLFAHSASRGSQQSGLFFTVAQSHRIAQRLVERYPNALLLPVVKIVPHDPPRRQIMGQHAPGTPAAYQIEDRVEDLPLRVLLGPPRFASTRNEWIQNRPF